MRSIAIVDTSYLIHRAIYKGTNMYNSAGIPTGGAYLFYKMLWKIRDLGDVLLVVDRGRSSFRKRLYPEYKERPRVVDEGKMEMDQARDVTTGIVTKLSPKMGIPVIGLGGQEADDVAYVLAKILVPKAQTAGVKVFMVSDDNDWLFGLNIGAQIYKPMKNEYWDSQRFEDEFGFSSKYFALYKALIGDVSDNINHINGVGPKTAAKLISVISSGPRNPDECFDPIRDLVRWAEDVDQSKLQKQIIDGIEIIKRNMKIMDLEEVLSHGEITVESVWSAYRKAVLAAVPDFNYVRSKFNALEFQSLGNWLSVIGGVS